MKQEPMENRIKLDQPAVRWEDALPLGNGTLGALVHGNIAHERIIVNHEALWLRSEKPSLPDVSDCLPELREMLFTGNYKEADGFLDRKLAERGYSFGRVEQIDPYHPAFDIEVIQKTAVAFSDYARSLDFETGEACVRWRLGSTGFERRTFVSRTDDLIAVQLKASDPGAIHAELFLRDHPFEYKKGMGFPGFMKPDPFPIDFQPLEMTDDAMIFRARYVASGKEFGAVAVLRTRNGKTTIAGPALAVTSADEVLLLVKVFANESSAAAVPRLLQELQSLEQDYDVLFARHQAEHAALMNRVTLDMKGQAEVSRMFRFGRFLLVSSSRPGGMPAHLQGLWNGDYYPAWAADYHNDENVQMNYWAALPGNLPETTLPFFDYYESFLGDYRENARKIFGCRGIMVPLCQSTHGMALPGPWLNWTGAAGWLAQLFYDYWLFTGDRDFLENRVVPFLKEIALFYEDFLCVDPQGDLCFAPSLSPENRPYIRGQDRTRRITAQTAGEVIDLDPDMPDSGLATINATMDVAIAKEVLSNLCSACEVLGVEADGVARWRSLSARLPAYQVSEDGALKEWAHADLLDNDAHRHQAHLYPLFPGFEITEESDPALFKAAETSIRNRLEKGLSAQTAWSFAHMANVYARLGKGDSALECLDLLCRSCALPNLFTVHNDWRAQGLTLFAGYGEAVPFQIDANFGLTSAVIEMLVQSLPGMIKLLPALPSTWTRGKVTGLRARGCIQIRALEWDAGSVKAELFSATAQTLTVRLPSGGGTLTANTQITASEYGPAHWNVVLPAGKPVELQKHK
jgi:alpha-L-fucosidase 2